MRVFSFRFHKSDKIVSITNIHSGEVVDPDILDQEMEAFRMRRRRFRLGRTLWWKFWLRRLRRRFLRPRALRVFCSVHSPLFLYLVDFCGIGRLIDIREGCHSILHDANLPHPYMDSWIVELVMQKLR